MRGPHAWLVGGGEDPFGCGGTSRATGGLGRRLYKDESILFMTVFRLLSLLKSAGLRICEKS